MYAPLAVTKDAEIQGAIDEVTRNLAPDVVRIRYEIDKDWSGEWAISFRITLTDEAARNRLRDLIITVPDELERRLNFPVMGVFAYHNFRSVSEQSVLEEPAWA